MRKMDPKIGKEVQKVFEYPKELVNQIQSTKHRILYYMHLKISNKFK